MADVLLCCHFGLARKLSENPGVKARDKWLLDQIEEKQEKIFYGEVGAEGRGGLAATDKGKKELKTVLSLVRREVESCSLYGLWQLKIMTKNGGIIGGTVSIEDTGFFFTVEKKKNKKAMAINVERPVSIESGKELWKGGQMLNNLAKASQAFSLTFPLQCGLNCSGASCKPRLKEARYIYFDVIGADQLKNTFQVIRQALEA